jgi:type 2A phosphatase activator TIP41
MSVRVATSPELRPPQVEEYVYGDWKIKTSKSRIMSSPEEEELMKKVELPHLPDMLFLQNYVMLEHKAGLRLSFLPLDALLRVNAHEDLVHVSMSQEWLDARKSSPHLNKIIHPYDWTYTTDYSGTLSHQTELRVETTDEKIDYEKLKVQERIMFFEEIVLYEDELDDNGCTKLSVKIRVMPSGFFLLGRFYLRVDNTLIRVHDTRIYFQVGKDYLLREYSEREEKTENLSVDRTVWTDHNAIVDHLPIKSAIMEKIYL